MKTLKWENGVAQGLPDGHRLTVANSQTGFEVTLQSPDVYFRLGGFPTRKAAESAAEAALWRLSILPLPSWDGHKFECGHVHARHANDTLAIGDWTILIGHRQVAQGWTTDRDSIELLLRAIIAAEVEQNV